ncbi:MAG: DUF4191 domain-containing protein [Sciscionella sp.]|nr:DUF4191 domain-containing protein [Sciscionella sp.]
MAGKDKAATQEAAKARREASRAKRGQLFQAFKLQLKEDRALLPWLLGVFLGITAVVFVVGIFLGMQWFLLPVGILLGVAGALLVFGRRAQRNIFSKAEGQPGAGAWALDQLRGQWRVTQAVAGTTQLDAVHRVLGLPGVILVAEGAPHRVKSLLAQEKKRVSRVVGKTPIYDVTIGNDDGQVPLSKLNRHLMKLPRNISREQLDTLEKKLAALGNRGAALPKGPMPQGAKMRNVQRTIRRR